MTNFEYIMQVTYEKMELLAQERVYWVFEKYPFAEGWRGDFIGIEESREKAIEKEIEWLKEEKKND